MRSSLRLYAAFFITLIAFSVLMYFVGRHESHKVVWLSELVERTQGRKLYIVDFPIVCVPSGKELGRLQVDINLTNGKVRIVRNDAGLQPNCAR